MGAGFHAGDAKALATEIIEQKLALRRLVLDHDYVLTLVQPVPPRPDPSIRGEPANAGRNPAC